MINILMNQINQKEKIWVRKTYELKNDKKTTLDGVWSGNNVPAY